MKKRVISLFVLALMSYVYPVALNLPFKRILPTKRSIQPMKPTPIKRQKKPLTQRTSSFVRKPFASYFEKRKLKKQQRVGDNLKELQTSFGQSRQSRLKEKKYFDESIKRAAMKAVPEGTPNRDAQVSKYTKAYKDQVYQKISSKGPMSPETEHIKYLKYGSKIEAGKYKFKHTGQLQKLKPLPPTPGSQPIVQQQPPLTPKKPALKVVDPNFNPFDTPAKPPTGDTISSFFSEYD